MDPVPHDEPKQTRAPALQMPPDGPTTPPGGRPPAPPGQDPAESGEEPGYGHGV
jgi:hypothetical protein